MEQSKYLEEIRIWEHPPSSGTAQTDEKNEIIFEENQKGFLQPHDKTQHGMRVKPEKILGLSQKISFTVITWNPVSNCTCRKKNRSLFHWNSFDVTRTTCTTSDFTLEKSIYDYWNVDGGRELSDTWTGFRRFTILSESPPNGHTWSGRRLTRKQTTTRPDRLLAEM